LRFFEKTCKGIELLFPELSVTLYPFGRILHGFGDEAATVDSSLLTPRDQLGSFEYAQVLRDGRERDVVGRRQIADGGFSLRQPRQDAAPGGIGKRREGGVQVGLDILNHMV
jgi:hypothetical protein